MTIFLWRLKILRMRSKNHIQAIALFALLATILIISWFRYGLLYGGGDVGLPSYDPLRILNIAKFIWWDASAPGALVPHGLTSVPFQFAQAILQSMGLTYMAIQVTFFWLILFFMGYGMFLLSWSTFGKERIGLSVISGLFYMFNPYMMIGVWHRFIHTTLFLSAVLPFLYIFWTKWIRTGQYNFLLVFLLINFLGVYLFGTLAFITVILILLTWIAVFEILFPWKGLNLLKIIFVRFTKGIIFWLLIHSWWLIPSVGIAPAIFSLQHSVGENLSTLLSISQQTIIPYSIFGINPFYIYDHLDWGWVYEHPIFRLLPPLILIFLIPGFFKSITDKKFLFWGLLALLALFLAKGAAPPFGHIYIFGFSNIFALGVLRNPFEKLGILIPFSFAILFSIGINFYLDYLGIRYKKLLRILIGLIILLLFGVFTWPMWTGKLFGNFQKPALVDVPKSYNEADRFIKDQSKEGNILHLPLTTGESAVYNWQYGYHGVESSQLYFASLPSISRGFNIEYVDDALAALSTIFVQSAVSEDKIIALIKAFNVSYIILHKDMQWLGGNLNDPLMLEGILGKLSFLKRLKEFENLVVYEIKDEYFAPKIRFAQDVKYLFPAKDSQYWPYLVAENPSDFLTPLDPQTSPKLIERSSEIILMPKDTFFYLPYTVSNENVINELPAVRILPDSPLYPLIKIKENILLLSMSQLDRFNFRITLAGKRLVEVYRLSKTASSGYIKDVLLSYQNLLPQLEEGIIGKNRSTGLAEGEIPLESIFARHLAVLNILDLDEAQRQVLEETRDKLITMLKSSKLLSEFEIKMGANLPVGSRLVHKFEVPVEGRYEILLASQNSQSVYPNELKNLDLQIDNDVKSFVGKLNENFISYGLVNLSPGVHEISYHSALSDDLVKLNDGEYEVISKTHEADFLELEIEPLTGGGWYQLTFESWIKLGDKFRVRLIQDTDPLDPTLEDEKLHSFNKVYTRDPYTNYWNKYVVNLNIRPATQKAYILIIVEPWDDCAIILIEKKLCKKKEVRFPFEHPSSTAFKNIELRRIFRNPIFLRASQLNKIDEDNSQMVNFTQINPVHYKGYFEVDKPRFLIFSQTYHPGWKLILQDDKEKYSLLPTYMANRFANAYFLEKAGKYKFSLEFEPQRTTYHGVLIGLFSILSIIALSIWQKIKK